MNEFLYFLSRHLNRHIFSRAFGVVPYALVLFSHACSQPYNYEDAALNQQGSIYVLEVKGQRRYMSHDPISGLFSGTYETGHQYRIPRRS